MSPTGSVPWDSFPAGDGSSGQDGSSGFQELKEEQTICGLGRKTFFLVLIAALTIVAGAIGGGVGGGLAAARARERSGDTSAPDSTDPDPTPTIPSSTSTTDSGVVPTMSYLNNQTGPVGFGFQGWSKPNYEGEMTPILREEGFYDLGIDCVSYVWLPNATQCCITFCANKHNATGWRCDARKRELASAPFPRLYIWCDQDVKTTHANDTCS